MCGILCLLHEIESQSALKDMYNTCMHQIQRRGPDFFSQTPPIHTKNCVIELSASVLWLQGAHLTKQPIHTSSSLFAFNGDVFGGTAMTIKERLHLGDTVLFLKTLEESCNIVETLYHKIEGPYAFVWLDRKTSNFYFGRDVFGRRSLLLSFDTDSCMKFNSLMISSVAVKTHSTFIEVPAIGIFRFNLETREFTIYSWPCRHKYFYEKVSAFEEMLECKINIQEYSIATHLERNCFQVPELHQISLCKHLESLPSECVFKYLLDNDESWRNRVTILNTKLENAIYRRICTQPTYCKACINDLHHCRHSRVGILFSGGVDCTILALIADKFVEKKLPIDLLNVAFDKAQDFHTPDRQTGLQSLAELQRVCPSRKWNFLCINVSRNELADARRTQIANLIFPLNTILDDSLGCALWFAAKGKADNYESPCRVLLVGMGADELFGGYTRHRAALRNGGWKQLANALDEDWANIAHRNLARDDRVVSDHGRQLRTPYLDEDVVRYVQSLKVWQKTCPSAGLAQGVGEKILLRTLAYHLGLTMTAAFRKRALQFGSRIADKKENAYETSPRLVT